jgi:hypothetical protein
LVQPPDGKGFRGVTFAYNVRDKESVAKVLKEAETAGGKIVTSGLNTVEARYSASRQERSHMRRL